MSTDRHSTKNLKITIEDIGTRGTKIARIRPDGFWIDVIQVNLCKPLKSEPYCTLTWAAGGKDSHVADDVATRNFIDGLKEALEIYEEWSQ